MEFYRELQPRTNCEYTGIVCEITHIRYIFTLFEFSSELGRAGKSISINFVAKYPLAITYRNIIQW